MRLRTIIFALLVVFATTAGQALAASDFDEGRHCAEVKSGEAGVEEQVGALLCKARRAEEKAAWHEERARVWEAEAERQQVFSSLDQTGRYEPLAGFIADTHRRQKEKKLREAQKLRQKARLLAEGQGRR